jgi:glycerol-3-phosphate dehydrogenase (NAD(P)+)
MRQSPLILWVNGLDMTEQQPVAVLGGGSFGTAVANLLAENGHPVRQWMRDPAQAEAMRVNRENPRYLKGIRLHDGVEPVNDLLATLQASDLIFVALPSSALRSVLAPHAELLRGKGLVSLTKGIEAQSFKLMSQILEEIAPGAHRRAVRAEPGPRDRRACTDRHRGRQ